MPHDDPAPQTCSRRKFLALSGVASAALLARAKGQDAAAAPAARADAMAAGGAAKRPIGLELYSVRTELARDLPGTLRAVAAMGYEVVEFYAPYFDWTMPYAKEVRSRMDDLGLRCYSTHNNLVSFAPAANFAKAIELNQVLGTRHLILASAGNGERDVESWKTLCAQLSAAVAQLRPHGLTAGYHNHETEWAPLAGGPRAMEVIAANTPPDFVLQLDVGTCVEAGADPVAWIKANPGRIRSLHLKDWAPGRAADEKGYRVLFGEGVAPWAGIIAAAEAVGGVEFYLLEQEGSRFSEFETARRCLARWKKFRSGS